MKVKDITPGNEPKSILLSFLELCTIRRVIYNYLYYPMRGKKATVSNKQYKNVLRPFYKRVIRNLKILKNRYPLEGVTYIFADPNCDVKIQARRIKKRIKISISERTLFLKLLDYTISYFDSITGRKELQIVYKMDINNLFELFFSLKGPTPATALFDKR